ncbi:DMT family transporter [Ideonella oryzae]|uniref:DMT family transporter n=1 Tax=Ideonella oryzae TaxID=2937441 RepID=A0ABT1BL93_9BURK|nr:DMT family transporter [Ideonella oryzae]MCO5976989.1 DMT family transporter [Ideonella oryzae]
MNPISAPWAVAALLLATASWGSMFLVSKPMVTQLDPVWLTVVRYGLACLPWAMLLLRQDAVPWGALRRHGLKLTLLGLGGYGLFSTLCFYGLRLSQPSHSSVIMATMPFTTLGLRWWLDGLRPTGRALLGAALALAGVTTVAGLWSPAPPGSAGPHALWGDAITFAATLGWVVYTRGTAAFTQLSPLEYTALTALAALPWMLAIALGLTALGLSTLPTLAVLGSLSPSLLYLALVPTVAAMLAFNTGVRRLGPAVGTLFLNVVPVSVMVVKALQGHSPQAEELLGTALVALGLGLHSLPQPPQWRRPSNPPCPCPPRTTA